MKGKELEWFGHAKWNDVTKLGQFFKPEGYQKVKSPVKDQINDRWKEYKT